TKLRLFRIRHGYGTASRLDDLTPDSPVAQCAREDDPDNAWSRRGGRRAKQSVDRGPAVVLPRPMGECDPVATQEHVEVWRRDMDVSGPHPVAIAGMGCGEHPRPLDQLRQHTSGSADMDDNEDRSTEVSRKLGNEVQQGLDTSR